MAVLLQEPQLHRRGRAGTMRARLFYTDDGVPYAFPELPAGTEIVRTQRKVRETFDDSGNDDLSIGTNADPDGLNKPADTDLTAAGDYNDTTGDLGYPYVLEDDEALEALYEGANSDATQGVVDVSVDYMLAGV